MPRPVDSDLSVSFRDPLTRRIAGFLESIGLPVRPATVPPGTFLPGVRIEAGALLVDEATLQHPGDLLHEAGHLALMPPERRREASDNMGNDGGEEMGAICWSYAAALHLELDPAVVFHADGYRGGGANLIENFQAGRAIGLPMLQWRGLCVDAKTAQKTGQPPYPHMLRWLT